ncbi:UDP-N-acetylmuramate dehydrogenase [Deefgea tanakiae]|uniref:UDP-N-acetylenolpyruvoylglucosamine reductase n=1 Tax=Deefgea tanakiae TaxID=2865840 RepID=A0ABX8Z217_9NEIS|nr:UDP-N-acetylmuramate dehydrogenase [Deefgea tanakiae]QZA76612.1 UDP-N-acetylmuramate dehydrogenase [Deefgea tanakiae]
MPVSTSSSSSLTALNTLGLKAVARHILYLTEPTQIKQWRADPLYSQTSWLVLGGGSNLVMSEYIDKTVLQVGLQGKKLLREDGGAWYVAAAGGEAWHPFVQWTLAQGWGGLENLSLIPGTVGAAPVQNIGAYGIEIKDVFEQLTAIHLQTGEQRVFTLADCQFAYRDSVFKQAEAGQWVIVEVVFRLAKNHQTKTQYGDIERELLSLNMGNTPTAVAQAVINVRQRKLPDPAQIGNAGSYFKNPIVSPAIHQAVMVAYPNAVAYALEDGQYKFAAGWLIEQAGWKGKRFGPVGMYEKQALVLVNHGEATAADVLALEKAVQADVHAMFGIILEAEPVKW